MNPNICNHCGSEYEYRNGRWICRACGSYKPEEISNEEVTLLYTAYQKLRLAEFDEAEQAFEDILEKYPENPNAYWGRLMARYGIKYEEDFDGRMIPTCYATSIESVTEDKDYRKALLYADAESKEYYRSQVEYIERVRLEWIGKAKKEKPYDIFISYKDSDLAHGIERTQDSFAAQEIYIHLLEQGYRVFFSRESLRDKTGEKYEPYIFNALSTAKIMLVYGSSADYIKSTWLKNEWHRFAKRIASGEKHPEALLVACDGFSPSELPHALASRQCFDASRRTFFGDLDKCIERIMAECGKTSPSPKKEKIAVSALHEHSYQTTVVKPTCIAMGYTLHRCDCGEEYKDSFTPLADHSFKVTNRIEPTCKEAGKEEETCEFCGKKRSKDIPALGHQFSKWTETKRPTCTENGEEQRKCQRCGEIEKKALPKTGHSFGEWAKEADGTYASYCKNCGETKRSTMLPEEARRRRARRRNAIIIISTFFVLFAVVSILVMQFYVIPNAFDKTPFVFTELSDGTYEISEIKFVPEGGELMIPNRFFGLKITSIGEGAFQDRGDLVSVQIGQGITSIGRAAFKNCSNLTNAVIPDGVTSIGDEAFWSCTGLQSVEIPGSVTSIGASAFLFCNSLANINVSEENEMYASVNGNLYSKDLKVFLQYACGKTETVFDIPKTVTAIGDNAFYFCDDLKNVYISDGVTSIGKCAFSYCDDLTYVTVPAGVQEMDRYAFYGSIALKCINYKGSERDWNGIRITSDAAEWGLELPEGTGVYYNSK